MENEESLFQEFEYSFDKPTKQAMQQASKWAKILAIILLVIVSIFILLVLVSSTLSFFTANTALYSLTAIYRDNFAVALIFGGIGGTLVILWIVQLLKFGNSVANGIATENNQLVEKGFANLKIYFVVAGIFTILSTFGGLLKLL